MKKVFLASAIALGLSANVNAEVVEKDTVWAISKVAMVCSAVGLGAMSDDYFEMVGTIEDILGRDYEPDPYIESLGMEHAKRAMFDPSICFSSYGEVRLTVEQFVAQNS